MALPRLADAHADARIRLTARRLFQGVAVAVATAALGWCALWWFAAGEVARVVDREIAGVSSDEIRVTAAPSSRAGFPWRFGAITIDASVKRGPVAIKVGRLEAAIDPADRRRLWLDAMDIDGGALGRITRAQATIALAIEPTTGGRDLSLRVRDAVQAALPPAHVDIDVRLVGPDISRFDHAALADWRDRGGGLRDLTLLLRVGEGEARLIGEVALDAELRPTGQGNLVLHGATAMIDMAARLGLIGGRNAQLARIGAAGLARPDADGRPAVTLPVLARDGRLSVGPLTLATFGPLAPQ